MISPFQVFRHGARTPAKPYPNSPFPKPIVPSQLTTVSKDIHSTNIFLSSLSNWLLSIVRSLKRIKFEIHVEIILLFRMECHSCTTWARG